MKPLFMALILAILIPQIVAAVAQPASVATSLFSTPTPASAPSSSIPTSIASPSTEAQFDAATTTSELDATITTPPEFDGDVDSWIQEKWHLTTFWSCNTFDQTYTDCGWHEPVLPGGTEIAAAPRAMNARHAAFVAGAAAAAINAFFQ